MKYRKFIESEAITIEVTDRIQLKSPIVTIRDPKITPVMVVRIKDGGEGGTDYRHVFFNNHGFYCAPKLMQLYYQPEGGPVRWVLPISRSNLTTMDYRLLMLAVEKHLAINGISV